jgi:hypothetical protein
LVWSRKNSFSSTEENDMHELTELLALLQSAAPWLAFALVTALALDVARLALKLGRDALRRNDGEE